MNNNRFMTGMIAGSVLGITAGVYAINRSTPRQRRRIMRRGAKMARNATRVMDAIDMFR
ncbi:YtxH domain-containing protein [Wukongibacter sp. M2B1]|uniref:YtxH domain-containing protein n=1 Tax=Wukongibacter sp. M2B1 TaxID=3088895 RepID=UPI003D7BC969